MHRWLPAALVVLALGLTGCSTEPAAARDDTGAVSAAGQMDAFEVKLGDCLNEPVNEFNDEMQEVSDVAAVPCSEPHDGEVYSVFDLPDGEFPGDEEVGIAADERCITEFDRFVGVAYEDSELDFYTFVPTQLSWNKMDDREVVCVIGDPMGEKVTGSLEAAGR